jgi:hypothetical protein
MYLSTTPLYEVRCRQRKLRFHLRFGDNTDLGLKSSTDMITPMLTANNTKTVAKTFFMFKSFEWKG